MTHQTGNHKKVARHTPEQIELLRERLNEYRGGGSETPLVSWKGLSLDIKDSTGVHIPGERLRQFVEPVSRKTGKGPSDLTPERREAIRRFLMEDEYVANGIAPEEWNAKGQSGFVTLLVRIPVKADASALATPLEELLPAPANKELGKPYQVASDNALSDQQALHDPLTGMQVRHLPLSEKEPS